MQEDYAEYKVLLQSRIQIAQLHRSTFAIESLVQCAKLSLSAFFVCPISRKSRFQMQLQAQSQAAWSDLKTVHFSQLWRMLAWVYKLEYLLNMQFPFFGAFDCIRNEKTNATWRQSCTRIARELSVFWEPLGW